MPGVAQLQKGQVTRFSPGKQPTGQRRHRLSHHTPWNPIPSLLPARSLGAAGQRGLPACISVLSPAKWGAGKALTGVTWADSQKPSPKTPKHFATVTWPFQSSDAILLDDYCRDSNLKNRGALNAPPGHLTETPTPTPSRPLSASQVASVKVMTEPCSTAKFQGHSTSWDLLIGYALRPLQKVQKGTLGLLVVLKTRPAWKGSSWVPERAAPPATCTGHQGERWGLQRSQASSQGEGERGERWS